MAESPPLSISMESFSEHFNEICQGLASGLERSGHGQVLINGHIVETCYERACSSVPLFNTDTGINYYREAGVLAYWVAKLKPVFVWGDHEDENIQSVNEYIALLVAETIILSAHEEILADPQFEDIAESCRQLQAINLRNTEAMFQRIVNALRYQVKAAGSLPTLLEALYFIPVDDYAAWDRVRERPA